VNSDSFRDVSYSAKTCLPAGRDAKTPRSTKKIILFTDNLPYDFEVFHISVQILTFALFNFAYMKRILPSSVFAFLVTALLCGPADFFASNKPETLLKQQNSKTGFIENKGQIIDQNNKPNPAVIYLLNMPGMNVQLRKGGFSYDLYQECRNAGKQNAGIFIQNPEPSIQHPESSIQHPASSIQFHRIDINLVGANTNYQLIPSDPLPVYFNYFTAACPPEGIKNVKQYSKIIYKNIYPDIDLEFFTNEEHGYKYNFVIRPGGNIRDIRLTIAGPDDISLIHDTLKFGTRFGDLEEMIPESYYLVNDSRIDIKATFKKINNEVYGFSVDDRVPENSLLVIDPTAIRLWGTYYGGTGDDEGNSCSVDKVGNVFLAGQTNSVNNIASTGSYQETLAGNTDAFVAKFNAAGQRLWGTYFGGSAIEVGFSCVVDKSGNIYVSGETQSTSGIATPGSHQAIYGGGTRDCFIVKFDQAGNRLWGTYYGGKRSDDNGNITADNNGNVFLTGETLSDTGISTPGSYQQNQHDTLKFDAFLAKFDSNGVRQWGTYYGGEKDDEGQACTTDISGNVYFAGNTGSHFSIASPGAYQTIYGGDPLDAFLAKFTTGGQRIWATYYGGSLGDHGWGCDADSAGNICMIGVTQSLNGIASPGCFQPVFGGFWDDLVVKFDSSGQRLWGTYYGGSGFDYGYGCAFGWNDELFITGNTSSSNNISTPDSYQPVYGGGGGEYGMLVKFDAAGQRLWGTYYGGGNDSFRNCSYVVDDTLYAVGTTASTNNIASPGAWQVTKGAGWDAMLIKFLDCRHIEPAGPIAGPVNLCKPSTGVSYSIPSLVHAVNYVWTLPPGVIISTGAGTVSITVDVSISAISGWVMVKGFNKCGDSGDSDSLYVTINPAPVPVIFGPNITCAGTGKVYTSAPGKTNYQWSISDGGVITSGGTTTDNTVTVTWNTTGTQHVYLNYTDANGCDADIPTDYIVQVTPSPAVSISITPSLNNVCSGTQVTFTSTFANEGGNPVFLWQVNGINSGTNSSSYSYTPLNNDVVRCILTSSITGCIMNNPDTSNVITMVVNPNLPVSVAVTASQNPVCSGTTVTFTAFPINEGTTPSYQWKVNGIGVGTNLSTYTYIPLNGDGVTCTVNSNATCAVNNPATSPAVTMTVNPNLTVSISITSSSNPFCAGSSVTFTATPNNGGTPPSYQWKVNGIGVGSDNQIYSYFPNNGDVVTCVLNSNIACPVGNPATSNAITMIVNSNLPAGVTITATSNPFCPGSSVTFTATPSNGGTTPTYQWKVNGANVGINSNTYSYNPVNNDSIRCVMTSNLSCVTGNPASSGKIIMSGNLAPTVTFTSCFDTITTINAKPIKLKGGIPLGGTYSGPGVNSITGVFTPSAAGTGMKTITYSYTNAALCSASKSRSIIVQSSPVFSCGNNLTDIRDNKVYPTIQIGSQCWLASNLNFGTPLTSTQDQRDNCVPEKYCYNDNPTNCTNHGGLYQWDELMLFDETPAAQGFCPPGWHIPTENEWNTLFANYINSGFAGSPLKYSGYSGFNALLSGARHINKGWDFQGFATFFWSSTPLGSTKAWAHGMNDADPSVSAYPSSRVNAFSVRCLKD
jgi:uncharacterized protein (TIGR02145 family)